MQAKIIFVKNQITWMEVFIDYTGEEKFRVGLTQASFFLTRKEYEEQFEPQLDNEKWYIVVLREE